MRLSPASPLLRVEALAVGRAIQQQAGRWAAGPASRVRAIQLLSQPRQLASKEAPSHNAKSGPALGGNLDWRAIIKTFHQCAQVAGCIEGREENAFAADCKVYSLGINRRNASIETEIHERSEMQKRADRRANKGRKLEKILEKGLCFVFWQMPDLSLGTRVRVHQKEAKVRCHKSLVLLRPGQREEP